MRSLILPRILGRRVEFPKPKARTIFCSSLCLHESRVRKKLSWIVQVEIQSLSLHDASINRKQYKYNRKIER